MMAVGRRGLRWWVTVAVTAAVVAAVAVVAPVGAAPGGAAAGAAELRPAAATPRTSVYFEGESGAYLLNGQTRSFSTIDSVGTRGTGILTFASNGWDIWFAVPAGQAWAPGTYEGAERADFRTAGHPGFDLSGESRGCNTVAARFVVDEVTLNPDGTPKTFSARFEEHCEGQEPAVFGQVSYNSTASTYVHSIPFGPTTFGTQAFGTTSAPTPIAVTNDGPDPLQVSSASLTGTAAASFAIQGDTCSGQTLAAGASCSIGVAFAPVGAAGTKTARLTVFDDLAPVGGTGRDVVLQGSAVDPSGEYTPVTPARVFDTRDGTGQGGVVSPLAAGAVRTVQLDGQGGLPASGVSAVVMNVTVTDPSSGGWVRIWPQGSTEPGVSNLNFLVHQTVANLVTVPVSLDGKVNIRLSDGTADVVFDVVGAYAGSTGQPGSRFHGITPARFLDTRVPGTPVGPGRTLGVKFTGVGGVPPSGVTAVALNVTVTAPTSWGWLTVFPADVAKPQASSVNFVAGQTVANMVIVRVPPSGVVDFYNQFGTAQVIADVVGYYDQDRSTEAGRFIPVGPHRIFDSRQGYGALPPDDGVVLSWTDQNGQPFDWLGGIVANATVTQPTSAGWITAFPLDAGQIPWVSNLNFGPGQTIPNQVMVRVSQPGNPSVPAAEVGFYNPYGYTHLIVDLCGVFTNANPVPGSTLATAASVGRPAAALDRAPTVTPLHGG